MQRPDAVVISEPFLSRDALRRVGAEREIRPRTEFQHDTTIFNWLAQGVSVIVNVSRKIIPQARQLIPDLKVIFVSVPLDVTLQRIKARNRESEDGPGFQQRLARAKENQTLTDADFVVDNSVPLEEAAEKLLGYMLSFN